MQEKVGILLVNLGSPEAPTVSAVRRYLRKFLSDPRVLSIHPIARWLLLNLIILPFRPAHTAKAYQKIWTSNGSPLVHHSQMLSQKLQQKISPNGPNKNSHTTVALGLCCGSPTLEEGLKNLCVEQLDQLIVLPLFPHYASATTGSVYESVLPLIAKLPHQPRLHMLGRYFKRPSFIEALRQIYSSALESFQADAIIFSYHGLPTAQLEQFPCASLHCGSLDPCDNTITIAPDNMQHPVHHCYRSQCYQTTQLITDAMDLPTEMIHTAFQSRLGKTPWIEPYLLPTMQRLADNGVKNLAIACPSFSADCLETLEEIGMAAKESWTEMGGENFSLLPCPNSAEIWVDCVAEMTQEFTRL